MHMNIHTTYDYLYAWNGHTQDVDYEKKSRMMFH